MSGTVTGGMAAVLRPLAGKQFTVSEVAERLGLARQTVARRARAGSVPGAFKVGDRWKAHADVIEAWRNGWWSPERGPWAEFAERVGLDETRFL